eukprot:TRINITY_DN5540_c0_g1_i3.p1 TRINITY_DN5540_c0_g1~~TRINITY_DN5540_c0_g1_i3.p1  ORF type:complete len:650 (+),score=134.23 TRINITY_DN5540_c0_g1_i3:146-2095(+)
MTENVSVSVRVRPLSAAEVKHGDMEVWDVIPVEGRATIVFNPISLPETHLYVKRPPQFVYDNIYQPFATNRDVFEKSAQHIVRSVMLGYNGTIFAYGQTSSGKTHTMLGTDVTGEKGSPGVISMAIDEIFECIQQTSDREFLLRLTYMEIYNEVVNDLLSPQNVNLKIMEDPLKGVRVDGLKEEVVMSKKQALSLISAGGANRHMGATNFNEQSSRSHTIFRMTIESRKRINDDMTSKGYGSVRVSYLDLIDLAGSERAWKEEGLRRKEGGYINKSLLTLATVISKLSSGDLGHVPYRDSKLTRILQPSLERNAKVSVICTITPSLSQMEETHSTLKFGFRAKSIKIKSFVTEIVDEKALLKQYRLEILQLKRRLTTSNPSTISESNDEEIIKVIEQKRVMEEKLKEHEQNKAQLEERIKKLTRLILTSSNPFPDDSMGFEGGASSSMAIDEVQEHVAAQPELATADQTGNVPLHASAEIGLLPHAPTSNYEELIAQLNEQLTEKQQEIEQLQGENRKKDNLIEELNTTVQVMQDRNKVQAHLQQQITSLRQEIQLRDERIAELMKAFTQQNQTPKEPEPPNIDILHGSLVETELQLAVQSADNQHLLAELQNREEELKRWSKQYTTLERRLQALEEENRSLKSRSRCG